MPTYTIVDKDKDPLGPNEVNSGASITVADGDVFIIDPSANGNIDFVYSGAGVPDIEVQMNASPLNNFDIKIVGDIATDFNVADNVDASGIKLDAKAGNALTFDAGNNVSFGQFDGATDSVNVVMIGDNFTTDKNWKFGNVDDVLIVGDNATFKDIDAQDGDDTISFGHDATVGNVDGKSGDDTITFKSGLDGKDIKGSDGNDTFNIGANANVNKLDGGNGTDVLNTKSPGANSDNFETTNVVCFGNGTVIETAQGPVAVEDLQVGQDIASLDAGALPLRWVGRTEVGFAAQLANPKVRPVRIAAGALGAGVPARDLFVSPNHRILLRSPIVARMTGAQEVFVAAKKLVGVAGIDLVIRPVGLRYYHLLLDQHAVVCSNGAASESLFLGEQSRILMGADARAELGRLGGIAHSGLARPCLQQGGRVARLVARHRSNFKPLWAGPSPAATVMLGRKISV